MNIINQLNKIITLLENDMFIQAHESFEDLWKEYKNDEKTREESFILKAFTNASISFEIYKMQRSSHFDNLWNTYKKYEPLIEKIDSINKDKYKQIQEIIYKKREQYIK